MEVKLKFDSTIFTVQKKIILDLKNLHLIFEKLINEFSK